MRHPPVPTHIAECNLTEAFPYVYLTHGILSIACSFCAIVGNGFIIIAVASDPLKKLRTPFNYFLVNLAVSDFLSGSISMPIMAVMSIMKSDDSIARLWNQVSQCILLLSSTTSVLSLVALSLDRYLAIKWPMKYRTRLSIKNCFYITASVWIISIGTSILRLSTSFKQYFHVYLNVTIIACLPVLAFTYISVHRKMQQRAVRIADAGANLSSGLVDEKARQTARKVTSAFKIIVKMFLVCYLPALVISYVLKLNQSVDCSTGHSLALLVFLLLFLNSCVAPIISVKNLRNFRLTLRYFITAIFGRRLFKNKVSSQIPSQ